MWYVIVALIALSPTLAHGAHFGTYGLLGIFGLGTVHHAALHNVAANDQIQEMAPWAILAWRQVHAGHLPLWNPYNAMGLPLAFNFQSAVFSLPMLVAYVFPVGLAYTVEFFVKMVIAGTGAFYLTRVLKADMVPSIFAGTIFELSGGFTGWLGWPQSGTFCWLGWILGSGLLIAKTRRRGPIAVFAVSLGFAIFGGHPEAAAITGIVVVLICAVVVAAKLAARQSGDALRGIGRLSIASLLGIALAAPLLFPGAQLLIHSVRSGTVNVRSIPSDGLVNFAFASFYGLPLYHSPYFGPNNYYEMAAYIGPIALMLSALALWQEWHRIEIAAIASTAVLLGIVVYTVPGAHAIGKIPILQDMVWTRAIVVIDLLLSALAGVGLQVVLRSNARKVSQRRLFVCAVIGLLALGAIYFVAVGKLHTQAEIAIRNASFIWPAISVVTALIVAGVMLGAGNRARHRLRVRPGRSNHAKWVSGAPLVAALLLAGIEFAFLFTATPGVEPSSSVGFVPTHAERVLRKLVGTARVGFVSCPSLVQLPSLGILPDTNDALRVAELASYDPMIPKQYVAMWSRIAASQATPPAGTFCPSIANARLARTFGLSFVLAASGGVAPEGTRLVGNVGTESLYRVPGSGVVTVNSRVRSGKRGPSPVRVRYEGGDRVGFRMDLARPANALIHVTSVPGWSATVNGRPLQLQVKRGLMFSARLPAGRDRVSLRYWPPLFTAGLLAALLAACAIITGGVVGAVHLRRKRLRGGNVDASVASESRIEGEAMEPGVGSGATRSGVGGPR